MTDIHRLQLFPAVFTLTPDADAKLPSSWGGPCVQLIAAVKATLTAIKYQAGPMHHIMHTRVLCCPHSDAQSKSAWKAKTVIAST